MIQRIQTLYLLAAITASIVCLCMPLGVYEPAGMGVGATMYNIAVMGVQWSVSTLLSLFLPLALSCIIGIFAIFCYKNRGRQSTMCLASMALIVIWYIIFAVRTNPSDASFHYSWGCILPLVSLVFYALARKGILHDEKLVRAADRIR